MFYYFITVEFLTAKIAPFSMTVFPTILNSPDFSIAVLLPETNFTASPVFSNDPTKVSVEMMLFVPVTSIPLR